MEGELIKGVLDLVNRYPNDSELGKNVRELIRKYKDSLDPKDESKTKSKM